MVNVYCFWDKGYDYMPPMIKYIYDHNIIISKKYNFNYILVTDENVSNYFNIPVKFYSLASNFKSDIVRYFILHKYGGIWLDSDIIIIKDLNILFDNFKKTNKWMMLDVEFNKQIGCASLVVLENTPASLEAVNNIEILLNNNKSLSWGDLGPVNITNVYNKYANNIILNNHDTVKKGCNFICWNEDPGYNKKNWILENNNAIKKSQDLINNNDCYYVITWTIYRKNDINSDIVDFVFKNEQSVFTHLVHKCF
jgi:mannosyltransferase OCH1-like enzyme